MAPSSINGRDCRYRALLDDRQSHHPHKSVGEWLAMCSGWCSSAVGAVWSAYGNGMAILPYALLFIHSPEGNRMLEEKSVLRWGGKSLTWRVGPLGGLVISLLTAFLITVTPIPGHTALQPDAAAEARALLDRFRRIDWDVRAAMSKQPNKDDAAWKTRLEVEHRLATLDRTAVPTLLQALDDSNRHVRALAAYVLGVRGETEAAVKRRIVLEDKDATVRLYAAEALGRIGDEAARSLLEKVHRSDPNVNVRYAAEQALLRLTVEGNGKGHLLTLARAFDPRQMALAVLGRPAPNFSLETNEGKAVRLSDFQGRRPVILLFQLADW